MKLKESSRSLRNNKNIKMQELKLGDITVEVIQKHIKNIHLSVHPPTGRVRISAPSRLSMDTIRVFAISKLGWIKKHQTKFKNQVRETPRDYISNESHFYNGKRYLLKVTENKAVPKVVLKHEHIELYVRPHSSRLQRKAILDAWYRERLKESIPKLVSKWEVIMKVSVNEFGIKRMKTKWGTCNHRANRIWLNLELAKKSPQCLEYIVVHEMVHLLEHRHNERFKAYTDKFVPGWKSLKEELNRTPISHVDWKY
ncbi:MAG: SprT family zinc-dependent metalloprotease [Bacteroidota bacterium]|nr:SprT family zinc-dependent metalloprotease [Bacteroidota bacterium]